MIVGIGIDVCEVRRMRVALERWGDRVWERVLSSEERGELAGRTDRDAALAAGFAAKEAAVKALAGAPGVGWHDLRIRRVPKRPPVLEFHGPAKRLADELGVTRTHVSITHDAGVAAAMVILEAGTG